MDYENKIVLNIGGQRFETNRITLKKIPATRLSRLTDSLANYDKILNEYFFDRHPGVFSQILNYYRTGKLHYPTFVCGPLFEAELEFWGLDSNQVEPCCWKTYTKHRNTEETLSKLESLCLDEEKTTDQELAAMFNLDEDPNWINGTLPWYQKIQPFIYQLFYEPQSSKAAKAISYISVMFILISILTYCLSTINGLCQSTLFCNSYNIRLQSIVQLPHTSNTMAISIDRREKMPTLLDFIEYGCIAWFTLEFGLKCFASPNKLVFFKNILNWIDIMANMWFYFDLIYNYFLFNQHKNVDTHPAWDLFGTFRIMRLFKLFNHFPGLRIIITSLRASAGILRLLLFVISVAVVIFASLVYYSEKLASVGNGKMHSTISTHHEKSDNQFETIVEAMWFSVASLTTVGFGDYCPKTPFGMFFGSICTIAGVLMIDLPMPIIVANYYNFYNHWQARSKFPKKLRRQILPELPRLRSNLGMQRTINSSTTIALVTSKIGNSRDISSDPSSFRLLIADERSQKN